MNTKDSSEDLTVVARKKRNEELIARMRRKESLWSFDNKASWFPPRPIIKKDADAIKSIYGDVETILDSAQEPKRQSPACLGIVLPLKKP